MKSKFEGLKQILYVLLPLLVFVVLYDIWTALTGHVLGIVLRLFGANGELWMENNTGTFQAVCIMGGLVGACVCLFKTDHAQCSLPARVSHASIPKPLLAASTARSGSHGSAFPRTAGRAGFRYSAPAALQQSEKGRPDVGVAVTAADNNGTAGVCVRRHGSHSFVYSFTRYQ